MENKKSKTPPEERKTGPQELTETSPVAITKVDLDGNIVYANSRAEEILGLEKGEITDRDYDDEKWKIADISGQTMPKDQLPYRLVKDTGEAVYDVRHSIERPDGELVLLSVNACPLRDETGAFVGVVSVFEDITEKAKKEEELRKSEERFRQVYDNISTGIARASLDLTIEGTNRAFSQMLGYEERELVGKKLDDITHRKVIGENSPDRTRLNKGKVEHFRREIKFTHSDGHPVFGILEANLVRDPDDNPSHFLCSVVDITERKEAEHRYREVVENAHDSIYTIHPEKGFQYVNPAFEELTGYSAKELCNEDFDFMEIIHPDDVSLIEDRAKSRKKGAELPNKYEFRIIAKDESVKTVTATTVPLPAKEHLIMGMLRNITGEKHRAELLDAFNRSAVEIEKALTSKSMFNSVSDRLKELGFDSIIYLPTEDRSGLVPTYLSFGSKALTAIEKLTGLNKGEYAIPNDSSTPHGRAVQSRETYFTDSVIEGFNAIFPDRYARFAERVIDLLNLPGKEIAAPIVVEDEVIGVFSLLANDLEPQDRTTVTAFARLLGAGFQKTRLFEKTREEISKRKKAQEDLEESERELRQSFVELARTTSKVIGVRDPYTQQHEQRVAELAREVGKRLELEDDRQLGLYLGGIIHDIGKIAIPETVLTKPGNLKDVEWEMIKSHPRVGFEEILNETDFPWPVTEMTLHHHERLDGSGYPHGLKKDELSLEVRILAVVDVVEAMSSRRPYRAARSKSEVLKEIQAGRGDKYDPDVVDILVEMIEEGEIEFG